MTKNFIVLFLSVALLGIVAQGAGPKGAAAKQKAYSQARELLVSGDDDYAARKYKEALKHYDEALAFYEHAVIYKRIALCLDALGQKEEAMSVYSIADTMESGNNK